MINDDPSLNLFVGGKKLLRKRKKRDEKRRNENRSATHTQQKFKNSKSKNKNNKQSSPQKKNRKLIDHNWSSNLSIQITNNYTYHSTLERKHGQDETIPGTLACC